MQAAEESDAIAIKKTETNHMTKELSVAEKKKLFILEKLNEEWELLPKQLEPKLIKLHWSRYEKWLKDSGIPDNGQLMNILLGLQEKGLITDCKWVNPAR